MEGRRHTSKSKTVQQNNTQQVNPNGQQKHTRSYVSNNKRAISAVCVPKRTLVHAPPHSTDTPMQDEPIIDSVPNSNEMTETQGSPTITQRPEVGESMNTDVETQPINLSKVPPKKVRGRTRGLNAEKVHTLLGRKIPITIKPEVGRPTGPYAEMFASEIGFTVRNHVTFTVDKWKHVDLEVKNKLVQRLTTRFDIDMSLPWVERYVYKSFGTRFTNFRNKLKKYFDKFQTTEEALKKKHEEIKTDAEWDFLCKYFSSDGFKSVSQKNAANREQLQYHHKAGSKSFQSHQEQLAPQTGEMSAIDRFELEYKSIAKGWDLGAKQKWDEMVLLRSETTQEDGTRTMTDEEICKQVLGAKSGYIKGCGFGPRPRSTHSSQSSVHEVYERNKELEGKLESQQEVIKALEDKAQKFEEFMITFYKEQAKNSLQTPSSSP